MDLGKSSNNLGRYSSPKPSEKGMLVRLENKCEPVITGTNNGAYYGQVQYCDSCLDMVRTETTTCIKGHLYTDTSAGSGTQKDHLCICFNCASRILAV